MPPPTWVTGQVLAASDVNLWFVPLAAYKTADLSRSSTTTPASDPDLTLALATSAFYHFACHLNYEGSATASQGIKWTWGTPAGTTLRYHAVFTNTAGLQDVGHTWSGATTAGANTDGAGNLHGVGMAGTLFTGTTSGNLILLWAQNVSEASAITLHAQSSLILTRIG